MVTKVRNRFEIDRRGGTFEITENDLAILALFNILEYIPSHYIVALIYWLHPTYVKNRLTILRHELRLIDCPPGSWEAANARYRPSTYQRTAKGTEMLRSHGHVAVDVKRKKEFKHELGVNLIAGSCEIGVTQYENLSIIRHPEIFAHNACPPSTRKAKEPFKLSAGFSYRGRNGKQVSVDEAHIIHDWFPTGFAYNLGNRTMRIFTPGFEFDRNTEPLEPDDYKQAHIVKKLAQTLELCKRYDGVDGYQEHYGIPTAVVPFWTINETHMRNMMAVLHRITNGKGSDRILFGSMNDFASFMKLPPANGWALTYDYKRVGYPDYNILDELGVENKKAAA